MRYPVLLFLLFGICTIGRSQDFTISGTVADSTDNTLMIGVNVVIRNSRDTTHTRGVVTDLNGNFEFRNLPAGTYRLRMSYVGYNDIHRVVIIRTSDVRLGVIKISPSITTLGGITVTGQAIPVQQKGDTVQYNANAFKTNKDATAEDLIGKMPGITIGDDGVKTQGENVKQVLVDGKRFFGDDASMALKNLPAEIIDKVEVLDRLSEQSQATGFDDGQTEKTINIVTKRGMDQGVFGKVSAGAGEDGRYIASAALNGFKGKRKLTLLGLSNNINQQNFTSEDLAGVSGSQGNTRGGQSGGSFVTGQQRGISTTNSGGLNYINEWRKVEFSGSYFFNSSNNDRNTNLNRKYITRDSGMIYTEAANNITLNANHRANFRLQYKIDSANTIIITPRFTFQTGESNAISLSGTSLAGQLVNALNKTNNSTNSGYTFSNNLIFRHRFSKKGRTVSLNLNVDLSERGNPTTLNSANTIYETNAVTSLDQRADQTSGSKGYSAGITFTEPVGKRGQVQLDYTSSLTTSNSDKRTFDVDPETDEYIALNTQLTNVFNTKYQTQRGGISYRYNMMRKLNLTASMNFQHASLQSEQEIPVSLKVDRTFSNALPQLTINQRFARGRNLRITYRTSADAPSVTQLQNVVNNSNPLFIRSGNPSLKQTYQHSLNARYTKTNADKGNTFLVVLYGSYTKDFVGNSNFFNSGRDSTLVNNVMLAPGQQITFPVNVPYNWNARTLVTYGFPVKAIRSNLNLNTGVNYNRNPSIVNDATNISHNYSVSEGIVLGSNISDKLDFTLSYNASYTIVQNTLTKQQPNSNYFTHTSSLKITSQPWKGLVISTNVNNSLYSGLSSSSFNQDIWYWNVSIGYKLLKNRLLEIKGTAFDILNQNKSISRDVTDTYIEDSRSNALTRYFMVVATYTLRKF